MPGRLGRRALAALVLVAALVAEGASVARAWTTQFGHVGAPDQTLPAGCHRYRYHYVVKAGSDDWMLETWLRDPRGRHRGAGDFTSDSDPARSRASFGICRSTVVPGRFTITARLRWYTPGALPLDPPVEHRRWFEPAHFRLSRP
jgi:hypothetical protein